MASDALEVMTSAALDLGWALESSANGAMDEVEITIRGKDAGVRVLLLQRPTPPCFATYAYFDPPLPVPFVLTSEGLLGKLRHALGMHDIALGDPAFDEKIRLSSSDAGFVKRLMTPEVRACLEVLHRETHGNFRVTESSVTIEAGYSEIALTKVRILRDIPFATGMVRSLRQAAVNGYR